jgi:predicted metallopeptidase
MHTILASYVCSNIKETLWRLNSLEKIFIKIHQLPSQLIEHAPHTLSGAFSPFSATERKSHAAVLCAFD